MHIQGEPAVIQAPTHRNLIGSSMMATPPSCYRPAVFLRHLSRCVFSLSAM